MEEKTKKLGIQKKNIQLENQAEEKVIKKLVAGKLVCDGKCILLFRDVSLWDWEMVKIKRRI